MKEEVVTDLMFDLHCFVVDELLRQERRLEANATVQGHEAVLVDQLEYLASKS